MSEKYQIKKNFTFNFINLVVNAIIAFAYTPFLVKSLGIIAYGVVPLALLVSEYASVFSSSLTGSLTRFYSIAFRERDFTKASGYLTSAFVVILIFLIIIGIFTSLIIWNLDTLFNIPETLLHSAKILFLFTLLSFLISLFSSFLNITLYANNRLDCMSLIALMRSVSRVLLVIVFFELLTVDIGYIGVASFIAEIFVLTLSLILFFKTNDNRIVINKRYFNRKELLPILFMTGWIIIHQIGDIGIYKIDIVFVNKFWTTKESGILGAFSSLGTYVMVLVNVVSSLLGPLILIAFSKREHGKIITLATEGSLLIGILSALMVGIITGLAGEFITLWLGNEYNEYAIWFKIKFYSIPFYASAGIFAFVYRSWNRVKIPALVTLLLGILNIVVVTVLAKLSKGNLEYINWILTSVAIITLLQTYGLGIYMLKKIYPVLRMRAYMANTLKILLSMMMGIFFSLGYVKIFAVYSWTQLIIAMMILTVIIIPLAYISLLNKGQRNVLNSYIKS